ncbi:MAG: DUF1002 domain-containing protein [Tissierellia bacterium]|nr:DUF1002 domain-containing protein [Tissierellia bacterium]
MNEVIKVRKFITCILIVCMLGISTLSYADTEDNIVVTLGNDLTDQQKKQMLEFFNVDENVRIVYVTNQEERDYFGEYIDESLIGRKALSSAYVEKLPAGSGITVETHNIFWVTEDMYRNACITAGIEDAKIVVGCPVRVSGTAALTGIIKAFEDASGEKITEEEKKTASEEIVITAELGEAIGKEKAQELINSVKVYIIDKNIKDKDSIEKVIREIAEDLSIQLTQEQIDQIISLMQKVSKLDLDIDKIKEQLKDISGKIDQVLQQNIEVKSLLQRILDAVINFFNRLFG